MITNLDILTLSFFTMTLSFNHKCDEAEQYFLTLHTLKSCRLLNSELLVLETFNLCIMLCPFANGQSINIVANVTERQTPYSSFVKL